MGARWRRPFCTSIRRDPETASGTAAVEKRSSSPRICAKIGGFFSSSAGGGGSNPSTPRLQSVSTPSFRCRTNPSNPDSPKSSARRRSSEPSSPRSPSRFALLKATFRLSRSRCGLCAQSVKTGDGAAVFTAECSHSFHLSCIAPHARNTLVCPVCSTTWRHSYPLLSSAAQSDGRHLAAEKQPQPQRRTVREEQGRVYACNKVYDDDEPLLLSNNTSNSRGVVGVRFNPIPEADDEDDDEDEQDLGGEKGGAFQGIFPVDRYPPSSAAAAAAEEEEVHHRHLSSTDIEVIVMPEVALVSVGRSHQNYVVALKVKAPPPTSGAPLLHPSQRPPIDLVTVLDVRGNMTGAKLHMLQRATRTLILSLGPGDRLSIVAFSAAAAKRLLPLKKMSRQGQRSARQIIDRLIVSSTQGHGTCNGPGDALRKATKVLDDRRERNPVATIMLLSDGDHPQQQQQCTADDKVEGRSRGTTTRFAHLEIPIHASEVPKRRSGPSSEDNPFAKCVFGGLLSVVLQHVHLQLVFPAGEICAVYSCGSGRALSLGGGGGGVGGGRGGGSVRLGDLQAGEERELLVELRVRTVVGGGGGPNLHAMSVKCSYQDGATQELIRCREQPLRLLSLQSSSSSSKLLRSSSSSSSSLNIQRLKNLFVATRAVAESRRLADGLNDLATAIHLLSSARSLLLQSTVPPDKNLVVSLDTEIADVQRRRQQQQQQQQTSNSPSSHRSRWQALVSSAVEDGREPLTPTSAWRAAERLAKLAIMRKSLNRISDLHGFEDARF